MMIDPAILTIFLVVLLGYAQADETCYRHDYPRRAFQWPRPKNGIVKRTTKAKPMFVDSSLTMTDAANSKVVKTAFDELMGEVGRINAKGCNADTTRDVLKSITVTIKDKAAKLLHGVDESYTLELKGTAATIDAATEFGARHAVVTLHNMLEVESCLEGDTSGKFDNIDTAGGRLVLPFDDFKIEDAPRLGHRGFMLDTARAYFSVDIIYEVLRVMGRAKMSVFHWHATDDHSFPLVMPKTAATIHGKGGETCMTNTQTPCLGAYSNQKTYSKKQIEGIISYAQLHGVRVIIEVDMPAHARSWGSVFPDKYLECHDEKHQINIMCSEPVCGPLALMKHYDDALRLAQLIFDDLDEIVPKDEIIHIGMDEVRVGCWGQEKRDQLMMKWLEDMTKYAATKKRRLSVWQDVLFDHKYAKMPQAALDHHVIGQVWVYPAKGLELLKNGVEVVWSDYTTMYLDCGRGSIVTAHQHTWCPPWKNWWMIYQITPDVIMTKNETLQKLVRGGEVAMWTELLNDFNLHNLIWPRVSSWGGATWEARTGPPLTVKGSDAIFEPQEHLKQFSWTMMRDCIAHTPLQTMWCQYGDAIPDSKGKRATREYCDIFTKSFDPKTKSAMDAFLQTADDVQPIDELEFMGDLWGLGKEEAYDVNRLKERRLEDPPRSDQCSCTGQ